MRELASPRRGEILAIDESPFPYLVLFDNGKQWRFRAAALTPDNPAPPPPPEPAKSELPGGQGKVADYITRQELSSLFSALGAGGVAEQCRTGTFGPVCSEKGDPK